MFKFDLIELKLAFSHPQLALSALGNIPSVLTYNRQSYRMLANSISSHSFKIPFRSLQIRNMSLFLITIFKEGYEEAENKKDFTVKQHFFGDVRNSFKGAMCQFNDSSTSF